MKNAKQPVDMPIKLAQGKTEFAKAINRKGNDAYYMVPVNKPYEPIMAVCGKLGYFDVNLLAN